MGLEDVLTTPRVHPGSGCLPTGNVRVLAKDQREANVGYHVVTPDGGVESSEFDSLELM